MCAAMAYLLAQPKTIVFHKPRRTFSSFLVAKDSSTPYSDATKTNHEDVKVKRPMKNKQIINAKVWHF